VGVTQSGIAQRADTVVTAQGKVINATNKEPVKARIIYESLPYGNRIGVINNSEYSFMMFDQERYSITVEAPGFMTAKYMLDPNEATQMLLTKDIELNYGSAVVKKGPDAGVVITLNNVIFEVAKSKIDPESFTQLDNVYDMLIENPKMVIQLEGHTDVIGNANRNLALSEDRVREVKKYLVTKGIDQKRIKTKAFGGTQPLSTEDTPEAHRLNRRVELRILKN
jgi:outer membrane protein OmpA-like peptidoglycan-associated protein